MTYPVVARVDIVPAVLKVTSPDGAEAQYDTVRVIVTLDTIYVWRENFQGSDPDLFIQEKIADFDGGNTRGYTATGDDGMVYFFRRAAGCACGSRIRSFRPFEQGLVVGAF